MRGYALIGALDPKLSQCWYLELTQNQQPAIACDHKSSCRCLGRRSSLDPWLLEDACPSFFYSRRSLAYSHETCPSFDAITDFIYALISSNYTPKI